MSSSAGKSSMTSSESPSSHPLAKSVHMDKPATLNYDEILPGTSVNFLEKHGEKTKNLLLNAMEKVERKGRTTKARLTTEFRNAIEGMEKKKQKTKELLSTEFRNAIEGMEKKKQKTKEILTMATTEIMYAFEEKDQKKQKRCHLKGGRIIPADGVVHFKEPFVYNATCGSVLELLFFQKFWIWLSIKVPMWIMPCTITFSGLALNVISCSILIHYSQNAKNEVPLWAFYFCSLGLFIYQTLDALDGKQGTKVQETQLEEMADHGCDSLSSCFVMLSATIALQMGTCPILMLTTCVLSLIAFYSTHWQTHVTDIVVFGKLDVTEAQCTMMVIHLITGMFGQGIWHHQIEWLGLEIRYLFIAIANIATVMVILGNLRIIAGGKTLIDDYVKTPRRKGLRILYPALPISTWSLLLLITAISTNLFNDYPCLLMLIYGLIFSKLLVKLQISNLGKIDCDLIDFALLVPTLLCINASLNIVPEATALISALVFNVMDFLRYATYLCWDICDFQDIHVFSLKYPLGHPKNRAGARGIYLNGLNNEQVIQRLSLQD